MNRQEAIKVIRYNWPEGRVILQEALETLVPKLKESEDERIRKELIEFVNQYGDKFFGQIAKASTIAWLEKQDKKIDVIENFDTEFEKQVSHLIASIINKEYEYTSDFVKWTANALLNYAKHELEKQDENDVIVGKAKTEKQRILLTETNGSANIDWDTRSLQDVKLLLEYGLDYINKLEKCGDQNTNTYLPSFDEAQGTPMIKQGEQKPADKVEPNFEIEKGKWYVCNNPRYKDFVIGKAYYCPKNGMLKPNENEMARYVARHCFHLWTIQDAKDGDVLADDNSIIIFRGIGNHILNDVIDYYVGYKHNLGEIVIQSGNSHYGKANTVTFKPAAKKQCDILFRKMKEAGYEWSDKDRKLIKIAQ